MKFSKSVFTPAVLALLTVIVGGCCTTEAKSDTDHGHEVWKAEESKPIGYKYEITIQPIRLTNDDGTQEAEHLDCKTLEAQTQAIYDQVHVKIVLLPLKTYANNIMYNGIFGTKHNIGQEISKAPIPDDETIATVFFVKNIRPDGSGGAMGLIGGRFMFLAEKAFKKNRLHVLAHELGHNLGLDHADFGAAEAKYTVMSGNPATEYHNIYPQGNRLNYITQQQHAKMLDSPLVIPIDPLNSYSKQ